MKRGILFISCEEAIHLCDKMQYGEASSWEKLKLKLRISWCHVTRSYAKKNQKLTDVIKKSELKYMSPEERKLLKSSIQQQLKKL